MEIGVKTLLLWWVAPLVLPAILSDAFLHTTKVSSPTTFRTRSERSQQRCSGVVQSTKSDSEVKVGTLLSDLPTPSLLLELSLAESAIAKLQDTDEDGSNITLDEALSNMEHLPLLEGTLFVHTSVVDTSTRDKVNKMEGSGKSQIICKIDTEPGYIPGGAYLGIGLANHLVGGYYWARGMGMGASLPAHGVFFSDSNAELYWKKRGPGMDAHESTEESSNSNDGKRSEWADFVTVGDTVQLVPEDISAVFRESRRFNTLLGVRRIGRPLGSDPIVEKVWVRSDDRSSWSVSE